MPLQFDYVTPSTGATASYHVVRLVALDYESSSTNATVASYLSKDAKDAGKFPMFTQQIQIAGLPAAGADALSFSESALTVAAPTDGTAQANPGRYVFAGATITA